MTEREEPKVRFFEAIGEQSLNVSLFDPRRVGPKSISPDQPVQHDQPVEGEYVEDVPFQPALYIEVFFS